MKHDLIWHDRYQGIKAMDHVDVEIATQIDKNSNQRRQRNNQGHIYGTGTNWNKTVAHTEEQTERGGRTREERGKVRSQFKNAGDNTDPAQKTYHVQ